MDVVIQGHEHAYARTCPLYKGECLDRQRQPQGQQQAKQQEQPQEQQRQQGQQQQQQEQQGQQQQEQQQLVQDEIEAWPGTMQQSRRSLSKAQGGGADLEPVKEQRATGNTRGAGDLGSGARRGGDALGVAAAETTMVGGTAGPAVAEEAAAGESTTAQGASQQLPPGYRAPVYVLAGHAGAGFTHGFPKQLPNWVEVAYEVRGRDANR